MREIAKCHARTMKHSITDKDFKMNFTVTPCAAQADCCVNKTREGVSRGGARREVKKRGRGMKDRVDKSMGIVILIPEFSVCVIY